jgi:hypothetical protein
MPQAKLTDYEEHVVVAKDTGEIRLAGVWHASTWYSHVLRQPSETVNVAFDSED